MKHDQPRTSLARRTLSSGVAITVLIGTTLLTGIASGGPSPPVQLGLERALGILEPMEKRIRVAQWTVDLRAGSVSSPGRLDTIDSKTFKPDPETYSKGNVTFEPLSFRYRFDMRRVSKWIQGTAPYSAHYDSFSFDGKCQRSYDRAKAGIQLPGPGDRAGTGMIEHEARDRFMDLWGVSSGIGFFPPYFLNKRVSELLKEANTGDHPVIIKANGDGIWQITLRDKNSGFDIQLDYDSTKNGAITQAKWLRGSGAKPFRQLEVSLQKVNDGFWAPHTMTSIDRDSLRMNVLTFSDVTINATVDDSIFTVTFPEGTRVEDRIKRTFYLAGPTENRH